MKGPLWQFMRPASLGLARKGALEALSMDASADSTSEKCIPHSLSCKGIIAAKSSFILCGRVEADAIFKSRKIGVEWNFPEGAQVLAGQAVCLLSGRARDLLACERTALNYLCLLSGIATKSAKAAKKFGKWKIAATRKTVPGLSHSEKRAVAAGGCLTHRLALSDGILVKDNHIAAIMKGEKVGAERAIEIACGSFSLSEFVEVEVSAEGTASAAALAGASAILIDNVSPQKLRAIARAAKKANPKIIVEASGGIRLANAGRYLEAGADFVSTSSLTMEIHPADMSLEIDDF